MILLLIFAFISGLITITAPCIWPLLPIILSSTATGGRRKPLGVVIGILVSFAIFTLTISYLVSVFKFDPTILRTFAVVIIAFLGLTLLIPALSARLEGTVSSLTSKTGGLLGQKSDGFLGGLATGIALGIVWSPCAGPILATIATLAATQAVNFQIVIVTIVYVIGVGIPLFIFALAGNAVFSRSRFLSKYTGRIQQVFGAVMILTAFAIFTNFDKTLQVKLLDAFPAYTDFVVKLESNPRVQNQLNLIRSRDDKKIDDMLKKPFSPTTSDKLPFYSKAADFVGITNWLNSPPLTIGEMKGKVVLVDFWTYTCINCIRTLPYITSWYEKYKDKGFVVVGVHTPEFEFEKSTQNVENAIKQYKINYPVAQDNDYQTWDAYNNRYWPAKYLVDKDGNIRYFHFGEGKYDETEKAIQSLLEEKGEAVEEDMVDIEDQTPKTRNTPETYLGFLRMVNFASPEAVESQIFTIPTNLSTNQWALGENWTIEGEFSTSGKDASLELNFYADKVFLVIKPNQPGDTIKVFLDGELINTITLDTDRLYEIINLQGNPGNHKLKLEFPNEDTSIFAFTFG
ncbi:cytochrome c biogenesis protein DipZ [Candidatus Gottesmanbacteria bacterium]|nr:cytochrome c biogenesis protein DipZ [Candidatus Gottesmanbacteria bacterium]